ncbi:succinylglutamate desuccinylase/aspartoacylase family protein [Aquimarina mytili]|uniref:Succinylglutamate desuccinylase/aspartoacylase family protein n=1 Tax=Aquimarina mytili TaxID=874423 RepID=A0A936ZVP4_9FLAO|nr:succinylglutamate desuccinylase/aspartoacylase family protein [Aquimarina mytili]MBL0682778.1 succinylglutamate desuccinylase/aspartoacylase family protein [Aquimarina mytili]
MIKVYSKALNETLETERIIGCIKGSHEGPTLIFIGGIHGNEPAGVFALHKVIEELNEKKTPVKGNIYAISGNLWALEHNKRYDKQDLNRLWTSKNIESLIQCKSNATNTDIAQQKEIYALIKSILKTENGPFYFMDLHTTSSKTIPFLTVNDSLLNRKYTMQYPVPVILGIEEYLEGPLLSYINELGYVAFGFEAGHHDDIVSITNNIAFIYLTLAFTGSVSRTDIDYKHFHQELSKRTLDHQNVYEIYWRHEILNGDTFTMKPGFVNFQKIRKGQELAISNQKIITSSKHGKIFMPLYQSQGNDGFFAIKRIPTFFLHLSAILRNANIDNLLTLLPGVQWKSRKKDTLTVNRKIARFFTKPFFHLLGYRSKQMDKNYLTIKNRETASRTEEYRYTPWIKNNV